ncbi:hypothetical protein [Streptomyces sp. WAC06614]|uniref:hypothetical protein n=1 Tax=Streptomyces sp. WAC06614 TaxID=2487416 RepID=UPI000F76A5BA|nr:hypothetical protein [Streptomyces sp. WAC06614]RSS66131.1 hypothetical protein EF918_29735 [Streptomyces sp. WAC06614]
MRKALVLSAAAVAAAVTIGSPAAAFAADQTAPLQPITSTQKPAQDLKVTVTPTSAKPGATVTVTFDDGLKDVTVSSAALQDVKVTGNEATGKVKSDATPGQAQITVSGTADGQKVSANASFEVVGTPPASKGTLTVTPGKVKAGSDVNVELKLDGGTAPKSVNVLSEAFADKSVALKKGSGDVWTGTARIGKDVKGDDYRVSAFSEVKGASPFAVTKLTVLGVTPDAPVKPVVPEAKVKPVPSEQRVVPKGSVDTGMAPAAASSGTADLTAAGIAAAGGAALLGITLYTRRRNSTNGA